MKTKNYYKKSEWCPPLTESLVGKRVYIPWPNEALPVPGRLPEKEAVITKILSDSTAVIELSGGYKIHATRYNMRPFNKGEWPKPEDNKRYWRRQ